MTCTCTILQSWFARAFAATPRSHRIRMTGINIPAVCKIWCTEAHGHYPWFRSWIRMSEHFFPPFFFLLFSSLLFFRENQRQTYHQSFRFSFLSNLFSQCLIWFNCLMKRKNCQEGSVFHLMAKYLFIYFWLIVIFKLRMNIEHVKKR